MYDISPPYVEAYRAYQSGLFNWTGTYRENEERFAKKHGKALSFVNVIYEITEMFVFMKRYYERTAPEGSVHVYIDLNDLKDRELVATDIDTALGMGRYQCRERSLRIERDYTVSELRASAEELALAW